MRRNAQRLGRSFVSAGPALRVVIALVVGVFSGCARDEPAKSADGRPAVLRLGYTPSEEMVADREEAQKALAAYLERALKLRVEVVRTASYGPAVEAMAQGEIDIMALGPFAYLLAAQRGAAEAVAVTGRADRGPRTYQSALIAHRRSGLTRAEDLVWRAKSLRFNYTDPASNSGHLVPQAKLASLGLIGGRDFASVDFTLSHSVAIFNVAFGKADVAGVSNTALQRLIARGRVQRDDLAVLWVSEPLPLGPITVRPALPAELKRQIQEALVNLSTSDPAAWRAVIQQYPERDLVYLACEDALFDGLRKLARQVAAPGSVKE